MIDLPPEHLVRVREILSQHVPECRVLAFGSRVCGGVKKHSDLDLAIDSPSPFPSRRFACLKEAFSESRLPIKVDVIFLNEVSAKFRAIILEKYEVVQPGQPGS